jgi:hypothetical protein
MLLVALLVAVLGLGIAVVSLRCPHDAMTKRHTRAGQRGLVLNRLWALGKATPATGRPGCPKCKGSGGVDCMNCGGKGVDKIKGDMFQRFMCKTCYGFGKVSCTCTGSRGLTPEQTGER